MLRTHTKQGWESGNILMPFEIRQGLCNAAAVSHQWLTWGVSAIWRSGSTELCVLFLNELFSHEQELEPERDGASATLCGLGDPQQELELLSVSQSKACKCSNFQYYTTTNKYLAFE